MKKKYIFSIFISTGVYFVYQVFKGNIVLSQSFRLGPLAVHYYGVCMALAVGVGYYLLQRLALYYGKKLSELDSLFFTLVVSGFVGARLYHVLSSLSLYLHHPLQMLAVWNGGLSIYGAVFGGFLGLTVYVYRTHGRVNMHTLFSYLDLLTWPLIAGQIVGRFGNLFNYELYGYPTSLPWKMFVPSAFRASGFLDQSYFHPLFLYEALASALVFLLLWTIFPPHKAHAGTFGKLFFSYLLLYNMVRFGLEFLRIDSIFIGQLRVNAAVSLALALVSVGMLRYLYTHEHYQQTS